MATTRIVLSSKASASSFSKMPEARKPPCGSTEAVLFQLVGVVSRPTNSHSQVPEEVTESIFGGILATHG